MNGMWKTCIKYLFIFGGIVGITSVLLVENFFKSSPETPIDDTEFINISELPDEFFAEFSKEYYSLDDNYSREDLLIITAKSLPEETFGAEKVIEAPNSQFFFQYASSEEKDYAYENLKNSPEVIYVDKNTKQNLLSSEYNSWGIEKMKLNRANSFVETNLNNPNPVLVAIIDTGLDVENFQSNYPEKTLAVYNAMDGTSDVTDNIGHGTHIAGTIAEGTSDNVGILAIKASKPSIENPGKDEFLYSSDIIAAINYAINNDADVLSMSFGSYDENSGERIAITAAREAGIINVAAAGNENTDDSSYPASYDGVISVSAVNPDLSRAIWNLEKNAASNYGAYVDFAAPGTNILSINGYKNGSSMATPHVAAAVAVLKSFNKNIGHDVAMELLKSVAIDLGDEGRDDYFGFGFIDFSLRDFCGGAICEEYGVFIDENKIHDSVSSNYWFEDNKIILSSDVAHTVIVFDGENYERRTAQSTSEDEIYSFNIEGAEEVFLVINGDVSGDGKVTDRDSSLIDYSLLSSENQFHLELSAFAAQVADVNGDGKVTARDSALIDYSLLSPDNKFRTEISW